MRPQIKKILYATDLSKNSAFAYQYATDFAEKNDAMIIILHVFEPLTQSARVAVESYFTDEQKEKIANQQSDTIAKIRSRLNGFCENVQKDDPECVYRVEDIVVTEGFPAATILQKADELDCDIIMMGTHGKGMIGHAFLGSVAEKVLRRSGKPVFTIPLPKGETDITVHDI
jgi:nucleotide-binding universal stress UspA family protein